MERAGKILGAALRQLKQPKSELAWLTAAWPALVGERLAARTRPIRCEVGVLEISAGGREWRAPLEEMKGEICQRINRAWGGSLVRGIRVVISADRGARLPYEADNEHIPFIRAGRGQDRK